jgi:hypothetical protein
LGCTILYGQLRKYWRMYCFYNELHLPTLILIHHMICFETTSRGFRFQCRGDLL